MKLIHIADLHLGKSIGGVSLIDNDDQPVWVERFLEKAAGLQPDAVVIAGDIYDRSSPSGDAVMLFDRLLTGLSGLGIPVLAVAGNHDSAERLSFARDLLAQSRVYIAGKLKKELTHVTIAAKDGSGEVTFWLMPYLFPALVSQVLEDETIREYDTAVRRLLEAQEIDFSKRNVLIAHQNVTAAGKEVERGGSESMVGGVGQIDYTAFDGFDYVALGHIHSAYPVGRKEVRYAGSPLCYHFDEVKQQAKGPLLVEIAADGTVSTSLISIEPLHRMRRLEDSYDKILAELEREPGEGEYLRIVVRDQKLTPEITSYLRESCRQRGSVVMELLSDYEDFSMAGRGVTGKDIENKTPETLFVDFYKERRADADPEEEELAILQKAGEILAAERTERMQAPDDRAVDRLLKFVLGQEE